MILHFPNQRLYLTKWGPSRHSWDAVSQDCLDEPQHLTPLLNEEIFYINCTYNKRHFLSIQGNFHFIVQHYAENTLDIVTQPVSNVVLDFLNLPFLVPPVTVSSLCQQPPILGWIQCPSALYPSPQSRNHSDAIFWYNSSVEHHTPHKHYYDLQ